MANDAAVTVRVPSNLKRRLAQLAARERRSLSAQVLHELERAVAVATMPAPPHAPALGLFQGARLPSEEDIAEVRGSLWGRMGQRRG